MSIGLLPSFITWLPASLSLPFSPLLLFLSLPLSSPFLSFSNSLPPLHSHSHPRCPRRHCLSLSSLWSTALRHDDAVFREHTTHKNAGLSLLFSQLSGDSPGEIEPRRRGGEEEGRKYLGPFKRRLFQHVLRLKRDIYRNKILRNQYFFFLSIENETTNQETFSRKIFENDQSYDRAWISSFQWTWERQRWRCMEEMFE